MILVIFFENFASNRVLKISKNPYPDVELDLGLLCVLHIVSLAVSQRVVVVLVVVVVVAVMVVVVIEMFALLLSSFLPAMNSNSILIRGGRGCNKTKDWALVQNTALVGVEISLG